MSTPHAHRTYLPQVLIAVPWTVASAIAITLSHLPIDGARRDQLALAEALIGLLITVGLYWLLRAGVPEERRRTISSGAGLLAPFAAVVALQQGGVYSMAWISACLCAFGGIVATGARGVWIGSVGLMAVQFGAPWLGGIAPAMSEVAYGLASLLAITILPSVYILRTRQRETLRTLSELPGYPALRSADGNQDRDGQTVLQRYLQQVVETLAAEGAVYWRSPKLGERLAPVAFAGDSRPTWERSQHTLGGDLLAVQSADRVALFDRESEGQMAAVAVPGDGVAGVLTLHARVLDVDMAVLARWLPQFASNLGNLAALVETQQEFSRQNQQQQALLQVAQRLQAERNLESLSEAICDAALSVTGGQRAALVRWFRERRSGEIRAVSPGHHLSVRDAVTSDSLVAQVCTIGLPQVYEDARTMERAAPLYDAQHPVPVLGSLCILPLAQGDEVRGAIVVEGTAVEDVRIRDVKTMKLLAHMAATSLDTVWQIEEATRRARTDALTGLANRRAFDETFARAIAEADRYGNSVGLVVCDVDHFKLVNDRFGHEVGDHVLRMVAQQLLAATRNVDLVARYGGEELVILLAKADLAMAWEVAERMRSSIEAKVIAVGEHQVQVTASFGVAAYPETARLGEELFAAADRATYQAKRDGRNCVRFARPLAAERGAGELPPEEGEGLGEG